MNSTQSPGHIRNVGALAVAAALVLLGFIYRAAAADSTEIMAPPPSIAASRLTLDEAIARALQHNQRIQVSDIGRGISRANLVAEYGHFEPSVNFRRSYSESESAYSQSLLRTTTSKSDDYSLTFDGLTPWGTQYQVGGWSQNQRSSYYNFANTFVTFGGVSVTQPLLRGFGFGASLANLRIAKADRTISDWEYRQTVIDTVTNVIVAYNNLLEARENLRIARRARDLAAQLVSDNERRNRVGSISDADVTQARARAANREEMILIAQRGVKAYENQLRELIGDTNIMPDGPDIALEPPVFTTPPIPDGATELHRALELRPDYQATKQGVYKRRVTRSLAVNQMLPRVDFVGSYGYNGVDSNFATSRSIVRNEDFRAYSAGLVVSVPLTLMEGRGRARAAKLGLKQSEADLVRLEQDIAVSVANAIGQLETTAQRVEATTRAYDLAQQALDAEEKRFRAGTSNTFVVLQLQEQLVSVEFNKVGAIADQRRALAQYEREIGTTLIARHLTVK